MHRPFDALSSNDPRAVILVGGSRRRPAYTIGEPRWRFVEGEWSSAEVCTGTRETGRGVLAREGGINWVVARRAGCVERDVVYGAIVCSPSLPDRRRGRRFGGWDHRESE